MKKTIFISSTYYDLVPYRQGIWNLLQSYNVEILGMEAFGARKSAPLETCISEVQKCDIFICIISMRYGSVDVNTNKSYTQLEYEKAVECGKEILIYIIDENKGFVIPKHIDFNHLQEKLIEFKNILKSNHTPDYFINYEDFINKIKKRIDELISLKFRNIKRPESIDSKIFRFKMRGQDWIVFVGYINNEPYEIHTGYSEGDIFPIPKKISIGRLTNVKFNDKIVCAFQYVDRWGYTNTLGGVDHSFNFITHRYDKIITKLLQVNTPLEVIVEVVNEMDILNIKDSFNWKKNVIKALKY